MFVEKTAFSWIAAQSRAEYIWRSTFWRCFMGNPVDWRRREVRETLQICYSTSMLVNGRKVLNRIAPISLEVRLSKSIAHNLLTATSNFDKPNCFFATPNVGISKSQPAFDCLCLFLPCSLPIHSRLPECRCCRRDPIRAILHESPSTRHLPKSPAWPDQYRLCIDSKASTAHAL